MRNSLKNVSNERTLPRDKHNVMRTAVRRGIYTASTLPLIGKSPAVAALPASIARNVAVDKECPAPSEHGTVNGSSEAQLISLQARLISLGQRRKSEVDMCARLSLVNNARLVVTTKQTNKHIPYYNILVKNIALGCTLPIQHAPPNTPYQCFQLTQHQNYEKIVFQETTF